MPSSTPVDSQQTPEGHVFFHMPWQPGPPPPLLVLLTMDGENTLSQEPYRRVGALLHSQGWNVVSFDLPCHGADLRPGEPPQMKGWAARTKAGENWVEGFVGRARLIVDHVIKNGFADPQRLAVAGTSRGGFMALQLAVHFPDMKAAVAFAPVTDLRVLYEFEGQLEDPLVRSWTLEEAADSLAGRPVWLIIGEQDERVGTDQTVSLANRLESAAKIKGIPPAVCLIRPGTLGHRSFPEWHDQAAAWLAGTVVSI